MARDPQLTAGGIVELHDAEGRLHAEGEPARVFPNGREEWYSHGRLHREDGPAILHANGSTKWYLDGVRHREGGPACEYVSGLKKWYRHGKHRLCTNARSSAARPSTPRSWGYEHMGRPASRPRLMSLAADDAGLPADPEFRSAPMAYVEWGTRLALENSQPGAEVVEHAPVPRWGWGEAPPYIP